jgi:polyisoprenoid-binding protein YceI
MFAGERRAYEVDPNASHVVINVDKGGLLSFAGHTHEVLAPVAAGMVVFDPDDLSTASVRVEFETSALRVSGRGEPADDVPTVQRTMESERVLDVSRFPRMTFISRTMRLVDRRGDRLRVNVEGDLTLHGVTRQERSVVTAELAPNTLTVAGKLAIRQTDFGIEPVTAGAGTVRVKDQLNVEFTLVARPASNGSVPKTFAR